MERLIVKVNAIVQMTLNGNINKAMFRRYCLLQGDEDSMPKRRFIYTAIKHHLNNNIYVSGVYSSLFLNRDKIK